MKMRNALIVLSMAVGATLSTPAAAQVSFGVSLPGVSIGVNVPVYPELVPVPGYPVYYAPGMDSNYFFYDGMYWAFQSDNWYASSWYNGPWVLVGPEAVPLYVLRVPVRYYRRPPVYFRSWVVDAPPRWGEHWGRGWEDHHRGWDQWNRAAVPAPAPLPVYQRQYTGNRYPQADQQFALQSQNYHYQPRDAVVRQQYQAAQAPSVRSVSPAPQVATPSPHSQPQPMNRGELQRPAPTPAPAQQAATPPARGQPAQISRGETPRPAPPQVATQPSREPARPTNAEVHRPAGGPPPAQQAAAPAPHPQPPQPRGGGEMRTAAAPPPAPQHAAAPPPAPQHAAAPPHEPSRAGGEPQQRPSQGNGKPNQEKDGERGGQGGGK
jgi:hypothetical protein